MEGSTVSLIEDVEDLIFDTRKRIISCKDPYTSMEIVNEDVILSRKNLKEMGKIFVELTVVRQIMKNTREVHLMFSKVLIEYLEVQKEVKELCESVIGSDSFDVSSLIAPYSHFDCSRLYDPKTEDSVDEDGVPTWVAPSHRDLYLKKNTDERKEESTEDEKNQPYLSERKRKKTDSEVSDLEKVVCSPIKKAKYELKTTEPEGL